MALNIAEMAVMIGLKLDAASVTGLNKGLDAAAGNLGSFATSSTGFMERTFSTFFLNDLYELAKKGTARVANLLNPFGLLGMSQSSDNIVNQASAYAQVADGLIKRARALDMNVEALQRYNFVAGETGVAEEQMANAISNTRKAVGEANLGAKEQQKTLRKLGLNYKQLAKDTTEVRFDKIIEGLAGIDNESKRAAIGAKLLGEGEFRAFATYLEQGADGIDAIKRKADSLGVIISEEDAKAAEAFNDAVARTSMVVEGLKREAITPLIKPLTVLQDRITTFIARNKEILSIPFKSFALFFKDVFGFLDSVLVSIGNAFEHIRPPLLKIIEALGGVENVITLATVASVAFFLSWTWITKGLVLRLLAKMGLLIFGLFTRTVLATKAMIALWISSGGGVAGARAVAMAAFRRISLIMGTLAFKVIALTAFFVVMFAILQDIFRFFSGKSSFIGKAFGLDPKNERDLLKVQSVLAAIGIILGVILLKVLAIPALILIFALLVAYLAANWDLVLAGWLSFYNDFREEFPNLTGMIEGFTDDIVELFSLTWEEVLMGFKQLMKDMKDALLGDDMLATAFRFAAPGGNTLKTASDIFDAFSEGSVNPKFDQSSRVMAARNNRQVNVTVEAKVDATGKSAKEAADIFTQDTAEQIARKLDEDYDGEFG